MIQEIWEEIPEQTILFIIYAMVSVTYLFNLNSLNQVLRVRYASNDAFGIISHNGNEPLWYIGGAVLLYIFAFALGSYFIRSISNVELVSSLFLFLFIALLIVILILIFNFINNPILKAVLGVLGVGGIVVVAMSLK